MSKNKEGSKIVGQGEGDDRGVRKVTEWGGEMSARMIVEGTVVGFWGWGEEGLWREKVRGLTKRWYRVAEGRTSGSR